MPEKFLRSMDQKLVDTMALMRANRTPYVELRQETRARLFVIGIRSNPGFSDWEIVNLLRAKLGLSLTEHWDEWTGEFDAFRAQLTTAIQEAGVEIVEPITEVPNIIRGLESALKLDQISTTI